ncbi:SRPBCC domain-containing protein [Actinokineospora sp. NBRC 105648]|uniref:SRPBCC family protein n=1 Tax=Actinokineospora sp. NBRC 105648 TaxID=3032206 RepID=UPI0024A2481A|nr:SRPBCC domain-containing protein [Actinokineospora sp. NBRC 105648]GLZ37671.1 hypothetical protein Acsp05_12960 [Actinokineospora sp. NBRC 105648]
MVGQTKDVGWNIGVSKTLPYALEHLWRFISSPEGTAIWLGAGADLQPEKGSRYTTADGTTGEVRSYHENDRVRLTWRPADWDHDTTVQVALSTKGANTTLRFHQEWLADAEERARQRDHWRAVLDRVIAALPQPTQ